jgi:hypothetical protein
MTKRTKKPSDIAAARAGWGAGSDCGHAVEMSPPPVEFADELLSRCQRHDLRAERALP